MKGDGGMNKSPVLDANPAGALRIMWPEPVAAGTVMVILVDVTDEGTAAAVVFTFSLSFVGVGSKLVPTRLIEVAGAATCGVNEVICGTPAELVTVKGSVLVIVPRGVIIVIRPVVAVAGTVATI